IAFGLEGIGIFALYKFGTDPVLFVILSGLVFFAWGEIYSLFPATVTDTFGAKYATTNTGLMYTAKGTASLLVPLANVLMTITGNWHAVFLTAATMNGIDTVFGLPGIPITDLTRRLQAGGMRVISFRHEQSAGYAAAIAGFMTQKPGVCLTVSAPGFLNGLTALANATTNCFPMILIS